MVNQRTVALSCPTFSHYTTVVDLDLADSIEEVIGQVVGSLKTYLDKVNLVILSETLEKMRFHVHDYTFEDMLLDDDPKKVYYLCNHGDQSQ